MAGGILAGLGLLGGAELFKRRGKRKKGEAQAAGLRQVIGREEQQLPAGQQGPPVPGTGLLGITQDPQLLGLARTLPGLLGTPEGREQAESLIASIAGEQQASRRQERGIEAGAAGQARGFEAAEAAQARGFGAAAEAARRTAAATAARQTFQDETTINRQRTTDLTAATTDLRNNFQKNTANFTKARQALSAARQAQAQGTGFGNIALLQLFIRSLDPGGRVTEGEVQVTGAAAGLFNELKAELDRIEGTGGVLSDEASQQLLAAAESIFAPVQADFDVLQAQFNQEAIRRGIDPRSVFVGSLIGPEAAAREGIPFTDSSQPEILDFDQL